MKIRKILTILLCATLMMAAVLTLSSCMMEEDYYTKSEVDALIETLKEEYDAKIAELEEKNTANEEKIEDLTEEYDNKITELIKIIEKILGIDSPSEENNEKGNSEIQFPMVPVKPIN